MPISDKTYGLIRDYGIACIRYGTSEHNSADEAKCERNKQNALAALVEHLEEQEALIVQLRVNTTGPYQG